MNTSILVIEQIALRGSWLDHLDALARRARDLGVNGLALGSLEVEGTSLDVPTALGALGIIDGLDIGPLLDLGHGRLASMMAREVTTLDHLINAGSLLVLRSDDRGRLDDAASVAHGLFTQGRTTAGGAIEYVVDAANLPRPSSPGGPALVAWDIQQGAAFVIDPTGGWQPMEVIEWEWSDSLPAPGSIPQLLCVEHIVNDEAS